MLLLLSSELQRCILNFLNYKELAMIIGTSKNLLLICEDGAEEAWKRNFQLYFTTQIEDQSKRFDNMVGSFSCYPMKNNSRGFFSWKEECKLRSYTYLSRWKRTGHFLSSVVCEFEGDVILAVQKLPRYNFMIAAGESGSIYLVKVQDMEDQQHLSDNNSTNIVFEMEAAHTASILALCAFMIDEPNESYPVIISGDASGLLKLTVVRRRDGSSFSTSIIESFRLESAIHQVQVFNEYIFVGLRDGRLVLLQHSSLYRIRKIHELLVHLGEVNVGLIDKAAQKFVIVTASTGDQKLKTWSWDPQQEAESAPPRLLQVVPLGNIEGITALMSCTSMAVHSGNGLLGIGFGNGSIAIFQCTGEDSAISLKRIIQQAHSDEVWEVFFSLPLVLSSSRDRTVAAHHVLLLHGEEEEKHAFLSTTVPSRDCLIYRFHGGWVNRITASPSQVLLMGFDARLSLLQIQEEP